MVDVTLPFGVLNNLPGVSGVDDVTVDIPTPEEIQEAVETVLEGDVDVKADVVGQLEAEVTAWGDVLEQGLRIALFDQTRDGRTPSTLLEGVAAAIAAEVDISGVTSQDIIEAVLDALDVDDGDIVLSIEGSLFATDSDFEDLLERAFEDADVSGGDGGLIDLPEIEGPLSEILDVLDGIEDSVTGLADDVVDEVVDGLQETTETAVEDAFAAVGLDDIDGLLEDITDSLVERLVSQEASDNLAEAIDY